MNKTAISVYLSLLIAAAMFLVFGGIVLKTNMEIAGEGTSSEAVIVEISTVKGYQFTGRYNDGRSYFPVVEFKTPGGETVRTRLNESNNSIGSYAYEVGDRLEVIFSVNNPYKVIRNSPISIYGSPLTVIGLGILATYPVVRLIRGERDSD